jgi:hypothetical protein
MCENFALNWIDRGSTEKAEMNILRYNSGYNIYEHKLCT